MRKFTSLSKAMFRGFFRDRVAVFFTFLFPLMFLVIFGLLFRDDGGSKVELGVVGDGPVIRALPADAVQVRRFDSLDTAVEQVRAGDLPAVVAQQGDEVVVRFAASDQVRAGTVLGLVNGVVSQANVAASGRPPRFSMHAEQVEDSSLKPIQYLTPGLLSWSVATSAVFGSALTLVSWRRRQVLRRLRLAPVSAGSVLSSRLGVAFVVALLQATMFILLAITPLFGLLLSGAWLLCVPAAAPRRQHARCDGARSMGGGARRAGRGAARLRRGRRRARAALFPLGRRLGPSGACGRRSWGGSGIT